MEAKEHYCEHCDETYTSEFMDSLPVRSFTEEEVAALDAQDAFDSVTGLDFHQCSAHPENAIATEQMIVERGGEFIGLQHVSELGWKVLARRNPEPGESLEESVEETRKQMKENALEKHDHASA